MSPCVVEDDAGYVEAQTLCARIHAVTSVPEPLTGASDALALLPVDGAQPTGPCRFPAGANFHDDDQTKPARNDVDLQPTNVEVRCDDLEAFAPQVFRDQALGFAPKLASLLHLKPIGTRVR